jgi:hypothetical protein
MNSLRNVSAVFASVAVVALVLVQFIPWGGFETQGGSMFGFSFPGAEADANMWSMKVSSGGNSDSTSWYDSDADDTDGIGQIRAGIPILLVGLVLALAGALATFGTRGGLGPILTMSASIVLAIGIILFAVGLQKAFDGSSFSWGPSFYFAITAASLLLVGGILGLMSGNQAKSA